MTVPKVGGGVSMSPQSVYHAGGRNDQLVDTALLGRDLTEVHGGKQARAVPPPREGLAAVDCVFSGSNIITMYDVNDVSGAPTAVLGFVEFGVWGIKSHIQYTDCF